jgi:hypothetical protein
MTNRISRLGFVVIKLRVHAAPYYLMRSNPKWKDVNFIGGHEKPRDAGSLEKTARRELWEEVPSIRSYETFHLEPLTGEVRHGPIFSKSRGDEVEYQIQFFLFKIDTSPEVLVEKISARSRNVWVSEDDLTYQSRLRISGLVSVLQQLLPGGLASIPYSSLCDLTAIQHRFHDVNTRQLELALK